MTPAGRWNGAYAHAFYWLDSVPKRSANATANAEQLLGCAQRATSG
jgi:hypothetical protein